MRCGSGCCMSALCAVLSSMPCGGAQSVSMYETNSITRSIGSFGSTMMQHVCVVFVEGSRYTRWIAAHVLCERRLLRLADPRLCDLDVELLRLCQVL